MKEGFLPTTAGNSRVDRTISKVVESRVCPGRQQRNARLVARLKWTKALAPSERVLSFVRGRSPDQLRQIVPSVKRRAAPSGETSAPCVSAVAQCRIHARTPAGVPVA